jgi:hypothetical protein
LIYTKAAATLTSYNPISTSAPRLDISNQPRRLDTERPNVSASDYREIEDSFNQTHRLHDRDAHPNPDHGDNAQLDVPVLPLRTTSWSR